MTHPEYGQKKSRTLSFCAEAFPVRLFQLLEEGRDLLTPEERCSLRLPAWLQEKDLTIFYLKMFPDCYRMTRAGRFIPSSVRFQSWGITRNGRCLTARISESHNPGNGCILWDILMQDVPEKYYLSQEQMDRLLYSCREEDRDNGSICRRE